MDDSPPWIIKFKQVAHSFSIMIWNPTGKCLRGDISGLKECSRSVELKAKVSGGPNVNTERTYNHLSLDAEAMLSSPFNDMDICQSTHFPHSLRWLMTSGLNRRKQSFWGATPQIMKRSAAEEVWDAPRPTTNRAPQISCTKENRKWGGRLFNTSLKCQQ